MVIYECNADKWQSDVLVLLAEPARPASFYSIGPSKLEYGLFFFHCRRYSRARVRAHALRL
jgi:hypothetical protein